MPLRISVRRTGAENNGCHAPRDILMLKENAHERICSHERNLSVKFYIFPIIVLGQNLMNLLGGFVYIRE